MRKTTKIIGNILGFILGIVVALLIYYLMFQVFIIPTDNKIDNIDNQLNHTNQQLDSLIENNRRLK